MYIDYSHTAKYNLKIYSTEALYLYILKMQ